MLPTTHKPLVVEGSGSGTSYFWKDSWKQAKPYNLVLPFSTGRFRYSLVSAGVPRFTFFSPGQMQTWMESYGDGVYEANSRNACYAKLIGKLRAQNANLGVTLGEHESARKIIVNRSRDLFGLASKLARRDFRGAYRALKGSLPSKKVDYPKGISGLWLEWSWGWAPMISDIGEALETLVSPITPLYIRASHTRNDAWRAYDSTVGSDVFRRFHIYEDWNYKYRCSTGCAVAVNNPNVALANRLGLINIPGIIWAVQPFSFIIDKYINIGQMIGSLSDTYGFTLSQTWNAWKMNISSSGRASDVRETPHNSGQWLEYDWWTANGTSEVKHRKEGLLGPTLALRTPSIGSFGEAVSYFALLIQLLSKG